MSLMVILYSAGKKRKYRKSKRNLKLKVDRFCSKHEETIVRATIITKRCINCKFLRNWYPIGHILIIHDADYEKWIKLILKRFSEYEPQIKQIIELEESKE